MPRIRPDQIDRESDLGQPLEKLRTRAAKHNAKLDRGLQKLCEEQKGQIEELSKSNLRLSRLISRMSHLLPKHVIDKLREEVDAITIEEVHP